MNSDFAEGCRGGISEGDGIEAQYPDAMQSGSKRDELRKTGLRIRCRPAIQKVRGKSQDPCDHVLERIARGQAACED